MAMRSPVPTSELGLWAAMRGFSRDTWLFLVFSAVKGVTFGVFMLTLNLYANAIGFTNQSVGLLNAVPAVGMFLVGLPVGILADRLGYKRFLLIGTALTALAPLFFFVMSPTSGIWVYTLVRSVGNPIVWVLSGPLLAALSRPEQRVHLFSINAFILTACGALGNLLGGWLPEWYAGLAHGDANSPAALQTAFVAVIMLNALLFVLVFFIRTPAALPRPAVAAQTAATVETVERAIQQRRFRWGEWSMFVKLILPSTLIGLGAGAFITFQQLYFHQRFLLSPGPIASIFAVSQVVTAVAILAAPWLAQRLGRVRQPGRGGWAACARRW